MCPLQTTVLTVNDSCFALIILKSDNYTDASNSINGVNQTITYAICCDYSLSQQCTCTCTCNIAIATNK